MAKFRTKPFEIEAIQFTGENFQELYGFCGWKFSNVEGLPLYTRKGFTARVYDELHATWVSVKPGQWIILGQKGEFYPCDPEIFEAKYEPVPEIDYSVIEVAEKSDPIEFVRYDE